MKKLIIPFVSLIFVCCGCDPTFSLTKVAYDKNTFKLEGPTNNRVVGVTVFEIQDKDVENPNWPKPVWRISNKRWLDTLPFRITVPDIPKGFVQDEPELPEKFQLRKGQLYEIHFSCKGGSDGTRWTAE